MAHADYRNIWHAARRVAHLSRHLARWWFPLAVITGIVTTIWQTARVEAAVDGLPTRGLIVVALFMNAWSLRSRQLVQSATRPFPIIWAVLISYGLLPCLGWLGGLSLGALGYADLVVGLLIVSSVPCSLTSTTIWTRLAGGHEATALLVTLATTASSWLVTTAWLSWTTATEITIKPAAMMADLLLCLVLPVTAGQLVRFYAPMRRLAAHWTPAFNVIGRLLLLAVMLKAVAQAVVRLQTHGDLPIAALTLMACLTLALHLVPMVIAYIGGSWLGFDRANRIAVAFSGSQKSLKVSLLLVNGYFRATALAVVPVLIYYVGQTLIDTILVEVFRERQAAADAAVIPFPGLADIRLVESRQAASSQSAASAPADSRSDRGDAQAA